MKIPEKLYHGTCKAFVAYALQNDGRFGPEFDSISFTPTIEYAKTFADSWKTSRGLARLQDYFGSSINGMLSELSEPLILEVNSNALEGLKFRRDCGHEEYYLERGSIDVSLLRIVEEENDQ